MLVLASVNTELNLERFVDAVRAGEFLSIPTRRVLELARQGKIPGYPIGAGQRRTWRFRLSELSAAISSTVPFKTRNLKLKGTKA